MTYSFSDFPFHKHRQFKKPAGIMLAVAGVLTLVTAVVIQQDIHAHHHMTMIALEISCMCISMVFWIFALPLFSMEYEMRIDEKGFYYKGSFTKPEYYAWDDIASIERRNFIRGGHENEALKIVRRGEDPDRVSAYVVDNFNFHPEPLETFLRACIERYGHFHSQVSEAGFGKRHDGL